MFPISLGMPPVNKLLSMFYNNLNKVRVRVVSISDIFNNVPRFNIVVFRKYEMDDGILEERPPQHVGDVNESNREGSLHSLFPPVYTKGISYK